MRSLVAGLERAGDGVPEKTAAGPALRLDWQVAGAGGVVLARCHVVVSGGRVLGLAGLGARERVLRRDPVLRRIFATFAVGRPGEPADVESFRGKAGDPLLVGVWLHEKHFGTGTFSSSTVRTFAFRADGTFVSMGKYVAANDFETTGSDTSRRVGGWTASEGKLTLRWSDGETITVAYHVEDPSQPGTTAATMGKRLMLVTTAEGARSLWTHAN
jgi:hypothetical protein